MNTNESEAERYFTLRMEEIREALNDTGKQEELWNDCLAIGAAITVTIELSTGGGGDGFEIVCDAATGEPMRGNHYYTNWGYRRECPLSKSELADVCVAYALEDGRQFLNRR